MKTIYVLIIFFSTALNAAPEMMLQQRVLNVKMENVEGSCSEIRLTYTILVDGDAIIPKGITGLNGEPILADIMVLRSESEFWGMKLDILRHHVGESNDGFVILKRNHDPLVSKFDLKTYFDLVPGRYYLRYARMWNEREFGDSIVIDFADSERYFLEVDSEGCVKLFE